MPNFQTITGFYETTTTRTSDYEQSGTSRPALAQPVPEKPVERKRVIRKKVDPSKFMTPYIAHSQKMQDLFSTVSFKKLLLMWFYCWEITGLNQLCFRCWLDFVSQHCMRQNLFYRNILSQNSWILLSHNLLAPLQPASGKASLLKLSSQSKHKANCKEFTGVESRFVCQSRTMKSELQIYRVRYRFSWNQFT